MGVGCEIGAVVRSGWCGVVLRCAIGSAVANCHREGCRLCMWGVGICLSDVGELRIRTGWRAMNVGLVDCGNCAAGRSVEWRLRNVEGLELVGW